MSRKFQDTSTVPELCEVLKTEAARQVPRSVPQVFKKKKLADIANLKKDNTIFLLPLSIVTCFVIIAAIISTAIGIKKNIHIALVSIGSVLGLLGCIGICLTGVRTCFAIKDYKSISRLAEVDCSAVTAGLQWDTP